MKKTTRGFMPIAAVVIVAAVLIAGGIYYKMNHGSAPVTPTPGTPVSATSTDDGMSSTASSTANKPAPATPPVKNPASGIKLDDSGATKEGVVNAVKDNNSFAIKLFSNAQIGGADTNAFISPWSISSAIGMTVEGAAGQTAAAIKKTMNFTTADAIRKSSFARISKIINTPNPAYELNTANALWAQNNFTFLPAYFTTVAKYYGGNVTNLDFINKPESSRVTINDWVAAQTKNKITNLLGPGTITNATRLVLTNAVYFKGIWDKAFDTTLTRDADFYSMNQVQCFRAPCPAVPQTVTVKMMNKLSSKAYFEDALLQGVELPYKGDNLSMVVLLPKKVDGQYADILGALSKNDAYLNSIEQGLALKKVDLYLPKFTFKKSISLSDVLKNMGMQIAFSGDADFSLMTGAHNLFISDVVHQAFIAVDEKGTEAAAATGVVMSVTSAMPDPAAPIEFRADHPFIFLIKENTTGQMLFIGKVNNPAQ